MTTPTSDQGALERARQLLMRDEIAELVTAAASEARAAAIEHVGALVDRALKSINAALDDGMLGAHAAHWDPTGGGGSGCPACKANAEARQQLYEAKAALSCVALATLAQSPSPQTEKPE